MNENKKNENVENNENVEEQKVMKAHRGHKRGRKPEPKFDPIGAVGGFIKQNQKWFIIGGCILGGIALGAGGAAVTKKAGEMEAAKQDRKELDGPAAGEANAEA